MKILKIISVMTVAILFSGCASMYVPDSDVISKLPILEIGSDTQKPADNEYILHIPAGVKIPVNFSVKGSLIAAPIENKSVTQIKKELYIYKYWVSFDGEKWQPTGDLIKMPILLDVGPDGSRVEVKVDLIK